MNKVGLGGSCHWCTEAIFQSLKGVNQVEQGWISSDGEYTDFSEAIIVYYDPEIIPLDVLIIIHLNTHQCTSNHSMRNKYRSAIYIFDIGEYSTVRTILNKQQPYFSTPIITKILPFAKFNANIELYQNYYSKNPDKPFCKTYIQPKLQKLMTSYSKFLK